MSSLPLKIYHPDDTAKFFDGEDYNYGYLRMDVRPKKADSHQQEVCLRYSFVVGKKPWWMDKVRYFNTLTEAIAHLEEVYKESGYMEVKDV